MPGMKELDKLCGEVRVCTKCSLANGRRNAVCGEGPADAEIMFIGEAPGRNENLHGRPFVGGAGKFLDELLESINLDRNRVYITNIVKCRPPENRLPAQKEVEACNPFLKRQIELIKPKVICTLGNLALKVLVNPSGSISKQHGVPVEREGITYLPLYHPAAALYTRSLRGTMLEDMKKLRGLLEKL